MPLPTGGYVWLDLNDIDATGHAKFNQTEFENEIESFD